MKRLTIWLAILLMAMCVVPQDREHYIRLGDLMKPKMNGFAVALDQAVNTTSSPTHVGLTLSGLTASTVVYSNASKAITSLANSAGYLYNNGSGTLSWGTVDLSAYLPKNGSTVLTGNWTGNAYQISRLVPVLALTDGATQAISATQSQNYVIHNGSCTQAIEMDLPAAAIGMQITVYVVAAFTVKLDPNLTDQIMVYTGAAGDYLISDAVAGTCISLVCLQVNKWHVAGASGSWTEE